MEQPQGKNQGSCRHVGESAEHPFSRVQSLQPAATLRGENLKCLLLSTAAEERKWPALLETFPAARMAQLVEESISEMDRYALAVRRNPTRRGKLSFS